MADAQHITVRRVAAIALPVVLSNATVPLQGAIDTAIIGNLGETAFLAAVALGATVITLLFSSLNFLQIGVSGLSAQALGADDRRRVCNTLTRAFLLAGLLALLLILFSGPVSGLARLLFEGSTEAEGLAERYVAIRLWGAPAELGIFVLVGWFTGQEMTRRLFELQLVVSVVNVCLNLLFAVWLGWGVEGIALGTALGAYVGFGVGLWRARARIRHLMPEGYRLDWGRILEPAELTRVVALNRDIFLRTICITGSFAWMARLGSTQGDVILAANGVLLQFVHISAYALDGFAMAAETLVGQAVGARDRRRLRRAAVVSTVAAVALAAVFSLAASLSAGAFVALFTNVPEVRSAALHYAIWATCLPLVGVAAYQLDGIFVGAADGPAMRNAMLASAAVFLPLGWAMTEAFGNTGLWAALWIFMIVRAGTLAIRYPSLEMRL